MALGLGHRYWVRMLKHHYGDLDSCIKFMQDNKPSSDKEWFELRPSPNIKKGKRITCSEYACDLVTDGDE